MVTSLVRNSGLIWTILVCCFVTDTQFWKWQLEAMQWVTLPPKRTYLCDYLLLSVRVPFWKCLNYWCCARRPLWNYFMLLEMKMLPSSYFGNNRSYSFVWFGKCVSICIDHSSTNALFINLVKSFKFSLKYTIISLLHVSVFNDHHQGALSVPN